VRLTGEPDVISAEPYRQVVGALIRGGCAQWRRSVHDGTAGADREGGKLVGHDAKPGRTAAIRILASAPESAEADRL